MYVADDMYFYFEEKRIALMDLADQEQIIIKLRHYPINREEAISNIYKKYKSHLTGFIYGYYTSFYFFDIVYENEKKGIQINDMVYSNTLELLNDTYQYNKGILGISSVIYYDIYQGIIGFDDINGHQWRLKNN
jgi:hypothetical protein